MEESIEVRAVKNAQDRHAIRKLRYAFQWLILIIVLYGGITLQVYFLHLQSGRMPPFEKPLSGEGFMPIGAFMALKLWITEGIFDPVHPAALVLFIAALFMALILKKGFCGWVCPVGTISELIWKIGKRLFRKNIIIPRFIDYPLRSLKYLLMGFFLWVILVQMSPDAIKAFLFTPYWKVADFKLLLFFTNMSITTLVVLAVLFALSLITKNFWCRYLCPYGALLGIISMISPFKVTRDEEKCIHCMNCTKSCPALLPVEEKERVSSPECIGCLTCVSRCPSPGALDISLPRGKVVHPLIYVALIFVLFWGSIVIARTTDHWKSGVTYQEYKRIIPHLDRLEHP